MSSLFFLLESLSRLRKTKIYMFSGGACIFASLVVLASLKRFLVVRAFSFSAGVLDFAAFALEI